MSDVQFFTASDGARLAWREMGEGCPLLLVHGYISDGPTNWITYGTAAKLAAAGYRCIMPDLRAHGSSGKPHEPSAYPPDILADDQIALLAHLGLTEFDICGYSLGARTSVRMLAQGCKPGRVVLGGMGYEGIVETGARGAHFRNILRNLGSHTKGSPEWFAEAFLKTTGGDALALDLLLDSFVDTPDAALAEIDVPVAVVCGADDRDNGSAAKLAEVLPRGEYLEIPGNHMSAVTKPEFGDAILTALQKGR